jgi:tRNA A-37 threonylcarbamoyl transferase component Bud32
MDLVWQSYLLMEYISGRTLYDLLRDSTVDERSKAATVQRVKGLLDELGRYRITHGDMKYTNILVTDAGPVLIDLDGMKAHKCPLIFRIYRDKDTARIAPIFKREDKNP